MSGPPLPRTYLYVPGNAGDKLAKVLTRGADALVLDLEDAVPLVEKEHARTSVVAWLGQRTREDGEIWIRVNAGPLRQVDVEALAGIPALTGLVLAKVEDAAEVRDVAGWLSARGDTSSLLMPLVETASAVLDAREIAQQDRVRLLQLGEVDLAGDLRIEAGTDEAELVGHRSLIVLASRAAGLESPMAPVSRITRDMDAFRVSTELAKRQGFFGRACIHPAQVAVVHEVYTPSTREVTEATEVLDLIRVAEQTGSGVVLDSQGRLVDAAVTHWARRVLVLAERSSA